MQTDADRAAAPPMMGGLWLPVCTSPADYSSTCSRHRCSVLVWRMRATHHTWRNIRNTELLFINIKMIKQVTEMRMRKRFVLFLRFWIHWPMRHWGNTGRIWEPCIYEVLNLLGEFSLWSDESTVTSSQSFIIGWWSIRHKCSCYYSCLKIISNFSYLNWLSFI